MFSPQKRFLHDVAKGFLRSRWTFLCTINICASAQLQSLCWQERQVVASDFIRRWNYYDSLARRTRQNVIHARGIDKTNLSWFYSICCPQNCGCWLGRCLLHCFEKEMCLLLKIALQLCGWPVAIKLSFLTNLGQQTCKRN